MFNKLLAICIPTYNGGDTLVNNVESILMVNDNRFVIHINDNLSTDNTIERLKTICERDKRLIITSNDTKCPAYGNFNYALLKGDAEYVFLLLDKELLNPDCLKGYLDFLETNKPSFGWCTYKEGVEADFEVFKKGLEAISSLSHFGNTHPSGMFYRKDLYKNINDSLLHFTGGGSWWITDLASASLGFDYDGVIYYSSIYRFRYDAVLGGISKSQSDLENLYYYGKNRCKDYEIFLNLVLSHDQGKSVLPIVNALTYRYLCLVTYEQRRFFSDKQRCLHYGVESRRVPYVEMLHWCREIKKSLNRECKKNNLPVSNMIFDFNVFRCLFYAFLNKRPYLVKVTRPIIQQLSRMKHK